MSNLIKYPKTNQFRQVVSEIQRKVSFVGLDEDNNPIYDNGIKKPVIKFKGTVKLHGTNASVCFNESLGFWTQSRQNIITPESDNAGFSKFANSIQADLISLIRSIADKNKIDLSVFTISVYGEWAGKGVQKSVGISQLEKALYIFGVKVSNINDENFDSYWIDFDGFNIDQKRVFNILDFGTYSVEVDFNMPQLSQNTFADITNVIEKECPVSKKFGINNGLGEGVVWSTKYKGKTYRFKVKGQKHSATKVKKLASVDVEKLKSIQDFVDYAVTENRVNQGIQIIFGSSENIERKKMGDFLRWIISDIMAEESDTLKVNGLEAKDVNKYISFRAREMFFKLEAAF